MNDGSPPPADAPTVHVDVEDRQQAHDINVAHLARLLAVSLQDHFGPAPAEAGLAFIGVEEMAELNQEHMGGSGPTDVLAFPIDGAPGAEAPPPGQPALLGDVVICPQVAAQAPQPIDDELALLVVHGALHLLGHDHYEPEETALMKRLEQELLGRYHRSVF